MAIRSPKKLLFQWHITDRCNLRCRHCYQDETPHPDPPFDSLLDILDQYKELLSNWRRLSKSHVGGHINVTGGEPFLRDDFPKLLQVLKRHKRFFSYAILTNGLAIDRCLARDLKKSAPRFVQVSLDGGRRIHDDIRGKGSFDQAVTSLQHLVKAGIRTSISFTAHKQNYHEFEKVADAGRELGVSRIWADRLIATGRGRALSDETLNADETWRFFLRMDRERMKNNQKTKVAMHRALQFMVSEETPYRCTAGDTLFAVQPNGDMMPCRRMPIVVGNVFQSGMQKLYFDGSLFRELRDANRISAECRRCSHATACRGGLRCLSYAVYDDPFRADPGCWIAHDTTIAGK